MSFMASSAASLGAFLNALLNRLSALRFAKYFVNVCPATLPTITANTVTIPYANIIVLPLFILQNLVISLRFLVAPYAQIVLFACYNCTVLAVLVDSLST